MSTIAPSYPSLLRVLLTVAALAFSTTTRAEEAQGGFTATLSVEQKNSSGLTALTPEERTALDQLVRAEVSQARIAGSTEFEGTFATRHNDEELHRAGLDRLTPEQLKKLNALIAGAVAAAPKPKERPRLRDSEVLSPQTKPQVHGEVSLTYGHVSGRGDFKGGSMWVDVFDPKTGISLGIGVSQFSGPSLYRYGYGYLPGYLDFGPGFGYGYDDYFRYPEASFMRSGTSTGGLLSVGNQFLEASYGWQRTNSYYRDFRRN